MTSPNVTIYEIFVFSEKSVIFSCYCYENCSSYNLLYLNSSNEHFGSGWPLMVTDISRFEFKFSDFYTPNLKPLAVAPANATSEASHGRVGLGDSLQENFFKEPF